VAAGGEVFAATHAVIASPLERFPITWNHVIEKDSDPKTWSMSLSKKSINFFGTCSSVERQGRIEA
jgi:hypothetical protein